MIHLFKLKKIFYLFFIAVLVLPHTLGSAFANNFQVTLVEAKSIPLDKALTLSDCYALALKQSEVIAINGVLIKETEAHLLQALSIVIPHLTFASNDTKGDATNLSNIYPKDTYERKFVFQQTLFSGFKAIAGITGSKLERNQRVQDKIRAEQLLFIDVSDAFYLLLEFKEDLKTLQIIKDAYVNRIIELKAREDLGRSRHSETVNTQAKLYRVEAEFETARSGEAVARQLLEFLTGRTINEITGSDKGFPFLNPESDYVVKAGLRPDVLAAEQAWGVAKKKVLIAKSDFFPTVSLTGNYYTARNTAPSDSRWDAGLDISVPIFEGTQTIGNVQEATLKAKESELLLQRTRRLAATDIRDAYVRLKDGIAMTKAMTKALTAAVKNYHLQKDDYVINLVSNLDVLDAIRAMGESRRDYMHSLFETKRLYWKLCVATGELPQKK